MSNPVGTLAVILNLKTSAFTAGLSRATGQVQSFAGQLGSIHGAANLATNRLLALVGVGGGFAGLAAGVHAAAERIDALAKASDKLGLSTESLAGFQYAASQTGVTTEAATTAMQKMVVAIGEAAHGSTSAQATFDALGVSVADLRQMTPDQQLRVLADAFGQVDGQAERVRLAVDLFGKQGAGLVNTLALGSQGLDEMQAEAGKLGLALSRVDAAKVEMAGDAIDRVKQVFNGVFNQLAVKLAPVLEWIAQSFVDSATAGDGLGATISHVVDYGVRAVGFFADAWQGLQLVFYAARAAATWVMGQIVTGIDGVVRATQAYGELFSRTFDVVSALWEQLGAGLAVVAQGIRRIFADLVAAIGERLAELMRNAAIAAGVFSDEFGDRIRATADRVSVATGTMAASAAADLESAKGAAVNAAQATGAAWDRLGQPIDPQGSETLQQLRADLADLQDEQWTEVETLRQQRLASDSVWEGYQALQDQATERAQAVADAAAATQLPMAQTPEEDPQIQAAATQQATLQQMEQNHQDTLSGIYQAGLQQRQQFAEMAAWGQARTVIGALEATTAGAAQHNKAMFQMHKVAATGNAIIATAEGVARALGAYPPPLSFAMAGITAAAGAVQIAAINSTQFGGGGGGATVSGSIPSASGGGADSGFLNGKPQGPNGSNNPTDQDRVTENGRSYQRQTLVVQGDFLRAEDLERITREARERNVLITEIRRG